MINVKHLMDDPHRADGPRLWVEPIGLTFDLRQWCEVDLLLPEFAPPKILWEWFDESPSSDRFELFRQAYRTSLLQRPESANLRMLAQVATEGTITLLHQCSDAKHNTATVLREVMEELAACNK